MQNIIWEKLPALPSIFNMGASPPPPHAAILIAAAPASFFFKTGKLGYHGRAS